MIVTVPNKVLTSPAKKVGKIDKKVKQVIDQMKKDLVNHDNPKGVGLAAPQIGVNLRIFITKPTEASPIEVFINPQIIESSQDLGEIERPNEGRISIRRDKKLEGCLSIPNVWGYLKRPKKVTLRYLDENGKNQEREFTGFKATIVQHETDHINGVLFTQRVLEQKQKLYRIEEDNKGDEELIEIRI